MSAPKTPGEPPASSTFYGSRGEDQSEEDGMRQALAVDGIDNEIALLRVELRRRVSGEQLRTIATAVNSIVRAVRTRHQMTPQDAGAIKRAILEEVQAAARAMDGETPGTTRS